MKQLEKYFDTAFEAPNSIEILRELILSLAMQGKLVHQNPDESHSKLFLKAKENKFVLQISQEELPYEIPKYWHWVRLGSITDFKFGRTPESKNQEFWTDSDGYPWASIADMPKRGYLEETAKKITHTAAKAAFKLTPAPEGSLLMSFKLSIGKTAITKFPTYHNEAIISFTDLDEDLKQYLFWTLSSIANSGDKKSAIKGNTLNSTSLNNLLVPLPPQLEQKRIVARIEELMSRCDELEKFRAERDQKRLAVHTAAIRKMLDAPDQETFDYAWQFISRHFGDLYTVRENVAELRKAILQLAVMGKLVPQDPKEGTARELLEEIMKEKKKLSSKGKLKDNNTSHDSSLNSFPFPVPSQWKWVQLSDIMLKITDGTHHSPPNSEKGNFLYISAKNIKDDGVLLSNATYVSKAIHNEIYSRCDPEPGNILYIKDGATTGIVTINNLSEPFSMLSSVALLKQPKQINNRFLLYTLRSPFFYDQMRSAMSGVAITRVTLKILNDSHLPLPPLAEQNRIVMKIDQLLNLCNALESHIEKVDYKQGEILGAVMGDIV